MTHHVHVDETTGEMLATVEANPREHAFRVRLAPHVLERLRSGCAGEDLPDEVANHVFVAHYFPDGGRTEVVGPVVFASRTQCDAALQGLPRLVEAAMKRIGAP